MTDSDLIKRLTEKCRIYLEKWTKDFRKDSDF